MRRAARGGKQLARLHKCREPKVGHLDLVALGRIAQPPNDENVLRLEVAVRHTERVAESDTAADLPKDVAYLEPSANRRKELRMNCPSAKRGCVLSTSSRSPPGTYSMTIKISEGV
mmetsp:Transcript_13699/g.41704  ORF Transcript_13699/g.41704 Transcript_13699/m.41704 type:complete len:116 (+) Transcript_13699:1262-1609(+)